MSECSCFKCQKACLQHPGWFLPGEAEKVSKKIGINFEEFSEIFLIKDHCSNQEVDDAPYVWSPRKLGVDCPEEKIRVPWKQRAHGRCIFLDEKNGCGIHSVKPFECREVFVCENKFASRDEIEKQWIAAGATLGMREKRYF